MMGNSDKLAVFGGSPAVPETTEPRAPWPRITHEDAQHVASVLEHTQPIIGSDTDEIVQLEKEWCRAINVPYCRAVGSGTAVAPAAASYSPVAKASIKSSESNLPSKLKSPSSYRAAAPVS